MVLDIKVEEKYKGPLDLLLYLIKRDEVDIHDIPISHVTREYLNEIEKLPQLDVEIGSQFLSMASMLMEIKGRMLLPPEEVEDDEESVELDPRAGLVEALLEYKRFKEAASALDEMYDTHSQRFPRMFIAPEVEEPSPEEDMLDANVYELYAAFARLMRETLAAKSATTIVATEISTEECMENIKAKIRAEGRVSFRSLFSDLSDRLAMVSYFVSILELIRLRRVTAFQTEDFSDIYVEELKPEGRVIYISDFDMERVARKIGRLVDTNQAILYLPNLFARYFCLRRAPEAGPFLPVRHSAPTGKGGNFSRAFAQRISSVSFPLFSTVPQNRRRKALASGSLNFAAFLGKNPIVSRLEGFDSFEDEEVIELPQEELPVEEEVAKISESAEAAEAVSEEEKKDICDDSVEDADEDVLLSDFVQPLAVEPFLGLGFAGGVAQRKARGSGLNARSFMPSVPIRAVSEDIYGSDRNTWADLTLFGLQFNPVRHEVAFLDDEADIAEDEALPESEVEDKAVEAFDSKDMPVDSSKSCEEKDVLDTIVSFAPLAVGPFMSLGFNALGNNSRKSSTSTVINAAAFLPVPFVGQGRGTGCPAALRIAGDLSLFPLDFWPVSYENNMCDCSSVETAEGKAGSEADISGQDTGFAESNDSQESSSSVEATDSLEHLPVENGDAPAEISDKQTSVDIKANPVSSLACGVKAFMALGSKAKRDESQTTLSGSASMGLFASLKNLSGNKLRQNTVICPARSARIFP